jgi:exodeoxyribonuclease V
MTVCTERTALQLTEAQASAVKGIMSNVDSGIGPSLLCGYAGTGKTVTTAALVSSLVSRGKRVVVATPTHKAKYQVERALEARGAHGFEAVTVHRLLGLRQRIDYSTGKETFEPDPSPNAKNMLRQATRWDEDLRKEVAIKPIDVVIVDETSMVASSIYRFLLEEAKGKSLIFVGDDRQLTPVGEDQPCKAFAECASVYRLTEVLRHDGAILNLATATRSQSTGRAKFQSATGGGTRVIAYERPEDWLAALLQLAKTDESYEDPDFCRVLAFSNSAVEEMNHRIHQYIYGFNAPEYAPGMVCVTRDAVPDPLGGRTLLHSTIDLLVDAAELARWRPELIVATRDRWGLPTYARPTLPDEIQDFFDDEDPYDCWDLSVEVCGSDQKEVIKVIAKSHHDRWVEAQNFIAAQAKQAKKSAAMEPNKSKAADLTQLCKSLWQLFYNRKNQVARIQPASALTVHKSQGSTFRHVFLHPGIDDQPRFQNQLAYVGITRAAETLHVIADR